MKSKIMNFRAYLCVRIDDSDIFFCPTADFWIFFI